MMLGAEPRPMKLEFWDAGYEVNLDIFTPDAALRINIPKGEALKFAEWVTAEEPEPTEGSLGAERPSMFRRMFT